MLAGEALSAKGNSADGIKELEIARADDPYVSKVHWDLFRAYTPWDAKKTPTERSRKLKSCFATSRFIEEPAESVESPAQFGRTPMGC